ncbi:Arm DNA-binding domain-containing protein [Sunxiuqinia indica]|uniref:Arm DNA-binding domain-containing protein n=1 Tax=Sunxiuqinia indica TaxID=2692584 RepID=UPI0013570A69|nr:Arm DNA-binding domain-containing protein [Sunxiuqinia indica]
MNQELELLIYIKKSETKQDETYPVMGRITIGKTMAQFSAKLTVPVSLWDTNANRTSGKSKQAIHVNRALDKISLSVNGHFSRLTGLNEKPTAT